MLARDSISKFGWKEERCKTALESCMMRANKEAYKGIYITNKKDARTLILLLDLIGASNRRFKFLQQDFVTYNVSYSYSTQKECMVRMVNTRMSNKIVTKYQPMVYTYKDGDLCNVKRVDVGNPNRSGYIPVRKLIVKLTEYLNNEQDD